MHLTPATAEERAAVEDLVRSTWEADKVGRGADARGLEHRAIQVGWLSYHTTLLEAKWSRVPSAIQVGYSCHTTLLEAKWSRVPSAIQVHYSCHTTLLDAKWSRVPSAIQVHYSCHTTLPEAKWSRVPSVNFRRSVFS